MDNTSEMSQYQNTYSINGTIPGGRPNRRYEKMSNSNLIHANFMVRREVWQQLEEKKPKYFSKSSYLQKIIDDHLMALENEKQK